MMPWIASALVFVGVLAIGHQSRWGWLVNLVGSSLWLWISLSAGQTAFVVLNSGFIVLSAINWIFWIPPQPKLLRRVIYSGKCCQMARRFDTGIIRENLDEAWPWEQGPDHALDWRPTMPEDMVYAPLNENGKARPSLLPTPLRTVLLIPYYCPWCGADIREAVIKRNHR